MSCGTIIIGNLRALGSVINPVSKTNMNGPREITQMLRTFAILVKDTDLIPTSHMMVGSQPYIASVTGDLVSMVTRLHAFRQVTQTHKLKNKQILQNH